MGGLETWPPGSDPSRYRFAECALVRSTNAVYKPYGVGRVVKARDDLAKVELNPFRL